MSDGFEATPGHGSPKATWAKPEVRQLRAGAAELKNNKVKDDADPGSAVNNS